MTRAIRHSIDDGSERRLLKSTAVVSAGTSISRILGFVREMLMAWLFGTSLAKSAFDVAFKLPNLFRRLFGEGALSAAFVPVFTGTLEKDGLEEANRFAGNIAGMLGTALVAIVLGGILLISVVLRFPGLGERASVVLPLLRIMLPYTFFICLVALCMGMLNSFHHFAVPALTPVLLNVVWISVLLFMCPRFGETPQEQIHAVAWGILLAGAVQLAVQIPALLRHSLRPVLSFAWRDARVTRVLLLMGPAAVGMGVHQLNAVVDSLLALVVGSWAPAALTYAERLIYLPMGVFATALSTVLLPTFSRQAARGRQHEITAVMSLSLRCMTLLMVPAAVGLIVLAEPVVRLVFVRGEFDAESTMFTVRALWFYAPGLVVFSIYKILVPAFYAMQDTRTPVRVGVRVVLLNFVLNVIFILTWPRGFKHAGLACASVLASAINCLVLGRILSKTAGDVEWGRLAQTFLKSLLAAGLMAVAAYFAHGWLENALGLSMSNAKAAQLLAVAGGIVVGTVLYSVLIVGLCRREIGELITRSPPPGGGR